MTAYALCRIQKIHGWAKLTSSEGHTTRERETLNANSQVDNIRLIGRADDPDLATMVGKKIGEQTIRKNAVLAVEMLLSASPEYFRPHDPSAAGVYDKQRVDVWSKASVDWLKEKYQDRVVLAELHLDESTPHIHAYLVPLDEKGKLNCRALFGGSRYTLSKLQDSYAEAVKPLELERGIKGSKATYTRISQYYTDVNRDSLHLDLEQALPQPKNNESAASYRERVIEFLQPNLDVMNHQLADRQLARKQKEDMEQKALASEKERQKLEQQLKESEEEKIKLRELANQLRDLPLGQVAYELGLNQDFNDAHKWTSENHAIDIKGSKFYDSTQNKSGKGALDLVMQVNDCNFKQSVAWLSDRFGESGMLQAVTHHARELAVEVASSEPPPQFTPPSSDETKWRSVQYHLTRECHLPRDLMKELHQINLVYADDDQNAVFLHRDLEGELTGATVAASDNNCMGLAPGSKRSDGWFYLCRGEGDSEPIKRAVITKSPIEALSLSVLEHPGEIRTVYMATDNPQNLPVEYLKKMPIVVNAVDDDAAGKAMAAQIKELIPHAKRLKPNGLNWNEDLGERINLSRSELMQAQSQQSVSNQRTSKPPSSGFEL